jgi:hypothetical protein
MHIRIRRRRFGQLVIASAAASAIANLPRRAIAQKSATMLYGVAKAQQNTGAGTKNIDSGIVDAVSIDSKTTDIAPEKDAPNKTPSLMIVAANVLTGKEVSRIAIPSTQVENINVKPEVSKKTVFTKSKERITNLTSLADGTLVVTSVVSTKEGNVTRVAHVDPQSGKLVKAVKVSGFRIRNSTLESLVATKDNNLIAIASLSDGIPPFEAVGFELKTGKVFSGESLALPILEKFRRYANLTLAPDGSIYGTTLGSEGSTTLIKINLKDRATVTGRAKISTIVQLKLDKEEVENDLLSLAISSRGQIYALANPKSKAINSLYLIDEKTGEMQYVRDLQVDKIAFSRA